MKQRIRLAWHVLMGRPLIYGPWAFTLAETMHLPSKARAVGTRR